MLSPVFREFMLARADMATCPVSVDLRQVVCIAQPPTSGPNAWGPETCEVLLSSGLNLYIAAPYARVKAQLAALAGCPLRVSEDAAAHVEKADRAWVKEAAADRAEKAAPPEALPPVITPIKGEDGQPSQGMQGGRGGRGISSAIQLVAVLRQDPAHETYARQVADALRPLYPVVNLYDAPTGLRACVEYIRDTNADLVLHVGDHDEVVSRIVVTIIKCPDAVMDRLGGPKLPLVTLVERLAQLAGSA